MKMKTMKPFEGLGERHVFCHYYSGCLDLSIRKKWPRWDCSKCRQRSNNEEERGILRRVDHSIAYYELSRET